MGARHGNNFETRTPSVSSMLHDPGSSFFLFSNWFGKNCRIFRKGQIAMLLQAILVSAVVGFGPKNIQGNVTLNTNQNFPYMSFGLQVCLFVIYSVLTSLSHFSL